MDINFQVFEEIQKGLDQGLPEKINQMGEIVFTESWKVAKALAPLVMAAEMTFIGFRVMFHASVVEQMTAFTRKFFICYLLVYTNLVIGLFVGSDSVLQGLKSAGQTLGQGILQMAPEAPKSSEPMAYWGEWIGDSGGSGAHKFDFEYQRKILFQEDESIPSSLSDLGTSPSKRISAKSGESSTGAIRAEDYFYVITLPMIAIGNVIATAGMQMTACLAPLFTGVGILHGSDLALRLILSLGICLVPLLFFHQFEKIFISYLHVIVGVALIPALFYLLSAVGFVLATQTYQIVVEKFHLTHELYKVFQQVADQTVNQMLNFTNSGTDYGAMKETLKQMLHYLGAYLCGTMVVASFVLGGVTMGAAAVSLALRWNQAFADEGMIQSFAGFFNRIEGGFARGLSQGMGSGVQGLGGLLGSRGRKP